MDEFKNLTPFEYYNVFTRKVFGALNRWFESISESVGLSGAELKVLSFLGGKPSDDTAQWVAMQLGMSKALVSKAVEQLSHRGYLVQQQDSADRRRYHLIVQPSARPLLKAVDDVFVKSWEVISSGISEDEFAAYLDVMTKIVDNIASGLGIEIPTAHKSEQ